MPTDIRQLTKAGEQFYPQTHLAALVGYGANGEAIDNKPTPGSPNLVKSSEVFESFNVVEKEINGDYLVLLSSLTVYQDGAYINGSGQITSNDTSKILSMPLGGIQTISYIQKVLSVYNTLLVEKNGSYVAVSRPTVANQTTLFDVSQYDSTYTLYVNWWGANTNDPSQYLDRITLLSKGLTEMVEDLEAASLKHEDELEQIFYNTAVSYGCGEDVYSLLNYITNDAIFFQSVSGQTYPQKVTRATFKKADAGTINFYKAKIENNVASNVVLIKSVNGAVSETELDVELGENEYIGIGGSFTYKNGGGTEYSSRTCSASGGNLSVTAGQVIGYTLYGTVLNSKVEDLESSVSELQDRKANVIIVDQSGKGNFTSLEDALHVVTDRTTPWGLTIIVKPGTYTMSTWVGNDERYYGAYRTLSIIGTNKNACKVICNKGVYTTSPYRDSAPIKLAGNCLITNLTIISSDSESEYPTADNKSYCIHLDNEVSPASPKRLTLKDCILQNDHYACVGIGLHNNYTVEIINCEISSTFKTGGDSVGAVLCHEGSDTGTCKLIMRNNVIKSSGAYGLSLHSPYSGSISLELCNNIIDADGVGFLYNTEKHIKDNTCFGNNIQSMNI